MNGIFKIATIFGFAAAFMACSTQQTQTVSETEYTYQYRQTEVTGFVHGAIDGKIMLRFVGCTNVTLATSIADFRQAGKHFNGDGALPVSCKFPFASISQERFDAGKTGLRNLIAQLKREQLEGNQAAGGILGMIGAVLGGILGGPGGAAVVGLGGAAVGVLGHAVLGGPDKSATQDATTSLENLDNEHVVYSDRLFRKTVGYQSCLGDSKNALSDCERGLRTP